MTVLKVREPSNDAKASAAELIQARELEIDLFRPGLIETEK